MPNPIAIQPTNHAQPDGRQESDLLQAIALARPRMTLRRARLLVQSLAGVDAEAATTLMLKWVESGCLVTGDATDSGTYLVHLGSAKPAVPAPRVGATGA